MRPFEGGQEADGSDALKTAVQTLAGRLTQEQENKVLRWLVFEENL